MALKHGEVIRTIKGPCFDCNVGDAFGCVCKFFPDSDLACPCHGSVRDTKPNPKFDLDEETPADPFEVTK